MDVLNVSELCTLKWLNGNRKRERVEIARALSHIIFMKTKLK